MMFIGAFFALLNFGAVGFPDHQQLSTDWAERPASDRSRLRTFCPGPQYHWKLAQRSRSSGWLGNIGTALSLVFGAARISCFLGLTVQLVVRSSRAISWWALDSSSWASAARVGPRPTWNAISPGRVHRREGDGPSILLGAGLTLTNGWVAAARAIPGSAEPAVDALDIAASAVLLLMICWNVPKFTAAILGGAPAFTGGDAVGVVGGLAQGALLAGAAVAGGVALGAKVLAARGGAMSVSQAAGMGAGGAGGAAGSGGSGGFGGGGARPASGASAPKPSAGGGGGQLRQPRAVTAVR